MPEAQATAPLEADEQQLLEDFERDDLQSVATPSLLEELRESARGTGEKDQRINIRLSSRDLQAIRTRALQQASPIRP